MNKSTEFRNSKKQITLNIFTNVIVFAVNIGISVLLTPFLINSIGKEAYSFYPISNTLVHYITIVATSLNTIGCRFISISLLRKNEEDANRYYSSMMLADFIMSLILLVPCALFVIFVNKVLDVPVNLIESVRFLFSFIFASAVVAIITSSFGVATMAKNRMDLRSYRELSVAIIKAGLLFVFYRFFKPTVVFIGVAALVCSLIMAIIQFGYTKHLTPELRFSFRYCKKTHVKELVIASVWVTINSLGMLMLSGTTIIIANIFYGATNSGTLSICLTIPNLLNTIITLLVSVLYPLIAHDYAKCEKQKLLATITNIQKFVGIVGGAITIVFCCFATSFYKLWTPSENPQELANYTYIIFFQYFGVSCFWVLTNLFIIMNKVKIPAIATLIAGCLNILIQVLLSICKAPLFTLPLVSSLLCLVWCSIFMPIYSSRITNFSLWSFYKPFIICIGVSYFVGIFGFKIASLVSLNSWLMFALVAVGYGILSLPFYFLTTFTVKEIKPFILEITKRTRKEKK